MPSVPFRYLKESSRLHDAVASVRGRNLSVAWFTGSVCMWPQRKQNILPGIAHLSFRLQMVTLWIRLFRLNNYGNNNNNNSNDNNIINNNNNTIIIIIPTRLS
jgi:hypothetical protein